MKKYVRILGIMLVFILIFGLFAGCAGKSFNEGQNTTAQSTETAAGQTTAAAPEDPLKDHMDITLAWWNEAGQDEKPDALFEKMEKDLNITLKITTLTWEDYGEKLNIWSASGQLPDSFSNSILGTPQYMSWVEGNVIKALPDDLSKYPNVQKVMTSNKDIEITKVNGKFYSIPRLNFDPEHKTVEERTMVIRSDWMANLGRTADPATMDEFIQLLKDFKTKDPDKNGKADTYGLTQEWAGYIFEFVRNVKNYGGSYENLWWKEDGNFIPMVYSKNMTEVVKPLRALYSEGLIDPDFAVQKSQEGQDKFVQGKYGAIVHGGTPMELDALLQKWSKANPDKPAENTLKIIKKLKSDDGNSYSYYAMSYWSEAYISGSVDDKKADRILRFYDYMMAPEQLLSSRLGIESKDYKTENGEYVLTVPKNEDGTFVPLKTIYPRFAPMKSVGAWNHYFAYQNPTISVYARKLGMETYNNNLSVLNPNVVLEVGFLHTPLQDKWQYGVTDALVQITMGKDDPVKMWETFLMEEKTKGLDALIAEVNAKAKETGIQ